MSFLLSSLTEKNLPLSSLIDANYTVPLPRRRKHVVESPEDSLTSATTLENDKVYLMIRHIKEAKSTTKQPPPKTYATTKNILEYQPLRYADLVVNEDTNRKIARHLASFRSKECEPLLVVHGPPGTGKSVAAKVIAQQSGYYVHEVRQSDGWTYEKSEIIWRIVTGQTQVVHAAGKRICVLLDGLDGCDDVFIRGLCSHMSKKGKSGAVFKALYPVLIVCNEWHKKPIVKLTAQKYGMANLAKLYYYGPVKQKELENRMRRICLQADLDVSRVPKVAGACQGDLRQGLLALGYAVETMNHSRSLAKLAPSLFVPALLDQEVLDSLDLETQQSLVQWCFELYAHSRFADVHFEKACEFSDWLFLGDSGVLPSEFYSGFSSFVRKMFACLSNRYNQKMNEARPRWLKKDIDKNIAIVESAMARASLPVRCCSTRIAISELYPYLCGICELPEISPKRVDKWASSLAAGGLTMQHNFEELTMQPQVDLVVGCGTPKQVSQQDIQVLLGALRKNTRREVGGKFYRVGAEPKAKKVKTAHIQSKLSGYFSTDSLTDTQVPLEHPQRVWVKFMKADPNPTRKALSASQFFAGASIMGR